VTDSASSVEDATPRALGVDYRKDLDFYTAVKEPKVNQNFHPEAPKPDKTAASAKKSAVESGRSASTLPQTGSGRTGVVSLQVAALKSSAEADRLAKTLRSKGYPVFIVNPAKEDPSQLIRVQIGPYTNEAEATRVKARLGTDGYTAISKR
jgi:cell division septation protein DedD